MIDLFRHHAWATRRLLEHCRELPADVLEGTAPGTYGSVIVTLRHLSGADERYLSVLEGRPFRPELMESTAELDIPALERAAADRAGRWEKLLEAGIDPGRAITREKPGGGEHTLTTRTLLVQAIHHGNDHRTHVCTILGARDLDVPDLDAWHFYDERLRPLVSRTG